jgi:hypothetical protein
MTLMMKVASTTATFKLMYTEHSFYMSKDRNGDIPKYIYIKLSDIWLLRNTAVLTLYYNLHAKKGCLR